jgi:hypothetical protein
MSNYENKTRTPDLQDCHRIVFKVREMINSKAAFEDVFPSQLAANDNTATPPEAA